MDVSTPSQTPTSDSRATDGRTEAGSATPTSGGARKPYTCPRLTEHGRLSALTFGPSAQTSDRNVKEGFEAVDRHSVLAAVAALPIERWSYKGEPVRHLGPMAQDFAAAFGLGADDRHIFPLDAAGVAYDRQVHLDPYSLLPKWLHPRKSA